MAAYSAVCGRDVAGAADCHGPIGPSLFKQLDPWFEYGASIRVLFIGNVRNLVIERDT